MSDSFYCSKCDADFAYKKNCRRHIAAHLACASGRALKRRADAAFALSNADNAFNDDNFGDSFDANICSTLTNSATEATTIAVGNHDDDVTMQYGVDERCADCG